MKYEKKKDVILWLGGKIDMDIETVHLTIEEIQKRRKQAENEIANFISIQVDKFQRETGIGIPSVYIDMVNVTNLWVGRLFIVSHCEIRLEI